MEGWHFRNEHNTAVNDGSVNAPQEIREFQFVFNDVDARTMLDEIEQFTSGKGKTSDFSPSVFFGGGKFIIKHRELGNLTRDAQAWIESMDFEVSLDFTPATFLSY